MLSSSPVSCSNQNSTGIPERSPESVETYRKMVRSPSADVPAIATAATSRCEGCSRHVTTNAIAPKMRPRVS